MRDVEEPLTLGRLLQERLLRDADAALDPDQAARPVLWCLPWGQALATDDRLAGVLVYARPEQLDDAGVRALERRDAAALLVAGPAALTTALPLLRTSAALAYRELSQLVADLTLARETHVLRYGLTVHRSLVELLYRGAGLAALCHQMARLAGCTAAVLDQHYRVLAFEQGRDRIFEPAAVATALRAAGLCPEPDVEQSGQPTVQVVRLDGIDATCVVNPILLAGRHDGWVLVIESADPPHPHDIAEHRVVVEQGATIVGTEMLRVRSVEQAEERARGDFVHALLHARFATVQDLEARAAYYEFPTGGSYGVIVAGGVHGGGSAESLTAMFQLARDVTRIAPKQGVHTLATVVGDTLAVIRQVIVEDASPEAATRELGGYAGVLEQELARRVRHPVAVAYGRPVAGAARIFDSYREARLALGLRDRLGIDRVCGFADLRVYATLTELARSPQGSAIARDVLDPLRRHRTGAEGLEQAVLTYIGAGGNLNAAARELHIHRNTMLYKLDRASRALHVDLRKAEHQFTVWLAHKLDLLAETAAAVDRDVNPS